MTREHSQWHPFGGGGVAKEDGCMRRREHSLSRGMAGAAMARDYDSGNWSCRSSRMKRAFRFPSVTFRLAPASGTRLNIGCSLSSPRIGAVNRFGIRSAGDSKSALGRGLRAAPAELVGSGLEHGSQPRIGEILQTEFKWVYPRCLSHRIHVRLTRKVVRGRCEPAIGSLAQRGLRRMVLDQLVGDLIWSADGGRARIVVVMLPRNQRTVSPDARLDLNHTGRAEIPPGEFLAARPQ